MAQLQHALETIEVISQAALNASKAFRTQTTSSASGNAKGVSRVRTSHATTEKRRSDAQRAMATDTVDVVDTDGHGMLNADLLQWSPHVSDSRLRDILASRQALLSDLRSRRSMTPHQFALLQKRAWQLVSDASDYARAVIAGELERMRSQSYQMQLSLNLQPAASSTSRRAQATTAADVLADSDDSDAEPDGNGALFQSDPLDLLSASATPYHSRGASVMEPDDDNSRAASPTLATAMAEGVVEQAAAAFDLLNQ